MEYWRVSSLVPGYMTVSWTVSPPAVGVRATCGVEGRPEGEMGLGISTYWRGKRIYISPDAPLPSVSVGRHS